MTEELPDVLAELNARDRVLRESSSHENPYELRVRAGLSFPHAQDASFRKAYKPADLENWSGNLVLEYGCGSGSRAFRSAANAPMVYAIDISEFAINTACVKAKKKGSTVDFRDMNAELLEFSKQSIDLICSTSVLHHLELARCIREMR